MDGVQVLSDESRQHRRQRATRRLMNAAMWILLVGISTIALIEGLALRRFAWEITAPIHFRPDIANGGYFWGTKARTPGAYLNLYEIMARQEGNWPKWLDYAPLRLAVMRGWAVRNASSIEKPDEWRADYAFNQPVLLFNTAMELVGAVCAFLLVRMWIIRRDHPVIEPSWWAEFRARVRGRPVPDVPAIAPHTPFRGWTHGMLAALLIWFNPAMILSAHGWPTWDMWVVPIYLLAILLACYDRWLIAGLVMGLGVMFKGQLFIGLPVFFAWTLLTGRWQSALRFACGFLIALAAVASPWMVTIIPGDRMSDLESARQAARKGEILDTIIPRVWNIRAILWLAGVGLTSIALPIILRRAYSFSQGERPWLWIAGLGLCATACLWPIFFRHDVRVLALLLGGTTLLVLAAFLVRTIAQRVILAVTSIAIAFLLCITFFNASTAWWDCGIAFGTRHWRTMTMGLTCNLPGLLANRFGWPHRNIDELAFTIQPMLGIIRQPVPVTIEALLKGLFILTLIPCLVSVARHARKHDPRFLVAITAPWLMFFCFPAQIHERYLLFAAGIGMVLVGQSVGMTLLAILLTCATWIMTIAVMLTHGDRAGFGRLLNKNFPDWFTVDSGNVLYRFVRGTFPDMGYAILLIAMIFLYVCMRATPVRKSALPLSN